MQKSPVFCEKQRASKWKKAEKRWIGSRLAVHIFGEVKVQKKRAKNAVKGLPKYIVGASMPRPEFKPKYIATGEGDSW